MLPLIAVLLFALAYHQGTTHRRRAAEIELAVIQAGEIRQSLAHGIEANQPCLHLCGGHRQGLQAALSLGPQFRDSLVLCLHLVLERLQCFGLVDDLGNIVAGPGEAEGQPECTD